MRYVFGFLGVFALSLALSVGCSDGGVDGGSGGTAGTGGTGGTSEKYDFDAVDSAAAAFVETFGLNGLTLAVVRKDEGLVYEKGYGESGSDRISLVASTSKVLAAGVILTLVDDGLLELD